MDICASPLSFELPDDPVSLREMVIALRTQQLSWEAERASLVAEKEMLRHNETCWRELVNILTAKRFGRSSEKWVDPRQLTLDLFDEAEATANPPAEEEEETATTPGTGKPRKRSGRKPLPATLPRVEVVHEIPESERVCGLDGSTLVEIGREFTEQLDIIPATIRVIRNVQVKYGCPHCRQGVHAAPMPPRILPKAMATASLLAHVVTSKYADGLPLYRLSGIMRRASIDIPRSTLANWMIAIGQSVQPIINLLQDHLLDYGVVQMDETTVQVLREPNRLASSKSFMWVRRGGPPDKRIILFDYDASRSGSVPKALLADFKGYLQTDGYDGYLAVGADPNIIHVGCFAHARRKFDEAIKALGSNGKKNPGKAGEAMSYIGGLYAIEAELREAKADVHTRYTTRLARAKPILDQLRTWANAAILTVPPKTALGKALGYLLGQWSRLIRYLDDGRLEIDNNGVENAIRPFVIGRKGWLFSNSVRGVKASANLYSLIETARANGLEPFAYLQHLFTQLPNAKTVDDYENLLPWNISPKDLSTG